MSPESQIGKKLFSRIFFLNSSNNTKGLVTQPFGTNKSGGFLQFPWKNQDNCDCYNSHGEAHYHCDVYYSHGKETKLLRSVQFSCQKQKKTFSATAL